MVDAPVLDEEQKLVKNILFRSLLQKMMQITTQIQLKTSLNIISRSQCNPGLENLEIKNFARWHDNFE